MLFDPRGVTQEEANAAVEKLYGGRQPMKITMDSKVRYRCGEKAVVKSVNNNGRYQVITKLEDGMITAHTIDGRYWHSKIGPHPYDLVPDESDTTHEQREESKGLADQIKENERLLSSCEYELLKLHIAELEAENKRLDEVAIELSGRLDETRDERDDAIKENERLREALACEKCGVDMSDIPLFCIDCYDANPTATKEPSPLKTQLDAPDNHMERKKDNE